MGDMTADGFRGAGPGVGARGGASIEISAQEPSEQLHRVLERIADGFLALNADWRVVYINGSAERILGRSRGDLLGRNVWEEFAEALPTKFYQESVRAMREQRPVVYEDYYPPFDRWFEVRAFPAADGISLYFTDVTERRLADANLREAHDLADTLNHVNEAISAPGDVDRSMRIAIAEAARALGADRAGSALQEQDAWRIRHLFGMPSEYEGTQLNVGEIEQVLAATEARRPLVWDQERREISVPPEVASRGLHGMLIVPLISRDVLLGVLRFVFTHPVRLDDAQLDFARKLGNSVALGLRNAQLLAAERTISTTLQTAALQVPAEIPGIEFTHVYCSASESVRVGGDFFDLFELSENCIGLVVGDVSGKGLEATAVASLSKNMIRAYALEGHEPDVVMATANRALLASSGVAEFVTAFIGELDVVTGELSYCCAGHPRPLLKRQSGPVELLETKSPLVGAFHNAEFSANSVMIGPEDLLILYTDGVIEARCTDGRLLGEQELARFARGMPSTHVAHVPHAVLAYVSRCTGGALSDDIVVLAVRRAG